MIRMLPAQPKYPGQVQLHWLMLNRYWQLHLFQAGHREDHHDWSDETYDGLCPSNRFGRHWFLPRPELRINDAETPRGKFRKGKTDIALRWLFYGIALRTEPEDEVPWLQEAR